MRQLNHQQLIELVDSIVGDEFCEDLNCIVEFGWERSPERTRELLIEARNKLADLYMFVHSHNTEHSCHSAHDVWREQAVQRYEKMLADRAAEKAAADAWKAEYDVKKAAETES
jgi:hypothetical protein